ncbi:cytochrome P450 [Micromonospora sp. R77]|uniref:cytochrome P450 n=1 Tax=Micromonospora sp. R77 TaxID=2925836 RepID=UPI001F61F6BF|nr:cytochrome P450 [Micromonospora sp. R77]MCI4066846.1 cytochrome P450 [Micromonospora sp. R77]
MTDRTPLFTAGGSEVNLADPHFFTGDRFLEVTREARRRHPVAWTDPEGEGFWSVTAYRPGREVLREPETFTSTRGMRLGARPAAVAAASGRMLVVSDGVDHQRLRPAHARWFAGRQLAGLAPGLRDTVERRLRDLVARDGPVDIVAELALLVPSWVLFTMMGVPAQDRDELAALTAAGFDDADTSPAAAAERAAAHAGVFDYFFELLEQRRADPGDDVVSTLANSVHGGRPLTDDEVVLNCVGLLNGGLETTPHAISGAVLAFARHPEQWRRLRADPALLDSAVEEILRYTSPPGHAMRTATRPTRLGDAHIAEGDRVVVWLPSCNRDEEVFPEPDRFLVDRRPNQHLGFGGGPHYCVGAALARLELRCVLAALLGQVAQFHEVAEPDRLASNFLNGLQRLDVVLDPVVDAVSPAAGPRR